MPSTDLWVPGRNSFISLVACSLVVDLELLALWVQHVPISPKRTAKHVPSKAKPTGEPPSVFRPSKAQPFFGCSLVKISYEWTRISLSH